MNNIPDKSESIRDKQSYMVSAGGTNFLGVNNSTKI